MQLTEEQFQHLVTAIKNLATDLERRTRVLAELIEGQSTAHKEELDLRDIAIDDLIAHKRKTSIVLELFREFHNAAKEVRATFEDERDRDMSLGDLAWLANHIADMNRADREDADRITRLEAEVSKLKEQIVSKPRTNRNT